MTWAPPGKEAHPNRWRYDLKKGFVPPGHSTDPAGTQYEMPRGFDPTGSPSGFHVVESPPGTAAPIDAINYTPDTREVHDVGMLAPVDKRNISLIPESGLHKLAYNRRAQRAAGSGGMGMGHDDASTFAGATPVSTNFPQPQPQQPQPNPMGSPTSAPPGSPFGRQPLGIGAGQDETDPTAGVDTSAPTGDETAGGADPNWADVGPEYTGHRRVDSTHVAEMVNGKPIGFWIKKPGATDLDPSAWSFRSKPAQAADKITWKEEPQPDGSIIMRASNGDVKRIAAPKEPAAQSGIKYGAPHRDESGNLVQVGSNGEVRVIERSPTAKAPATSWGQPYQAPDGSYVQQSNTGEIRAVPGTKMTTATEKWGPPESKPDGSIWQQNTSTGKWEIIQSPDTKLTDPFTVGNRLVKFDPESNSYKEVYRAPQNMSLQTLANGSIVGINQETGEQTPILDDPTAAAQADLKQRQGEQTLRTSETSRQAAEMGMIPQPYVSGGNLIVPEGAEADVTDWDPTTGQSSQRVAGHRSTVAEVLQSHGFDQPPAQTYTPPSVPAGAGVPSATPDVPTPSGGGATVNGALAPAGVAGTPGDPTLQADYAGNVPPPPDTGPQGGLDWLFSSPASPVDNPDNVPQAPQEEPTPDDVPTVDDIGAGADRRRSSDSQSDLMADIPRFAHKKKWKGLGSKFLGRGLDEFQPFVGAGQASGSPDPTAGQPTPPKPPPAGPGGAAIPPPPVGGGLGGPPMPGMPGMGGKAGKWDPKMLQQLLPLLLMLLSGGSEGGAQGGAPSVPPPAPAAASPSPPTPPMPGREPLGVGGMGVGQDDTPDFSDSDDPYQQRRGMDPSGPYSIYVFGDASGNLGGRTVRTRPPKDRWYVEPLDMGAGQDSPQGFQPPIDPQHVVGTGHKFGQAMNAGDPVHRGVDLQAPKGTPVKAPVDGVVKINHNPQGLGLEAVVVAPDGKEHKLGHLSSVAVKPGQQVKAGQVIGQVGDSGLTTGANLHYAEKKGQHYFNPSGKMGVLADLPPAPGTQMMSQGGSSPDAGAGQDEHAPPLKRAVMGSGADARSMGVGAGAQFTIPIPGGGEYHVNASDRAAAYKNVGLDPSGGGGGGGGGTNVSVDPATQARIQADLKIAQDQHAAAMQQLQQSASAEQSRHSEEMQRLQQAATQEADFRAVQEAVNAENLRHNQAQEQLSRQQQALDVQLEQMREQSSMALQRESEGFQAGQTARQNSLSILQGALSNPWLQALTKLGITPGGGGTSGANPLMNLLNQILGGANAGNLQQAGVPGGNQLPNVSPQEFQAMSTPQKAALRAQIEAMGPGMWEQFQSNFQNQAGTNKAPDQTQLQQAVWTPEDAAGSQMSAEMFGEGQPAFQQRQQKNWAPAQGTNVMQSLLAGTGFG